MVISSIRIEEIVISMFDQNTNTFHDVNEIFWHGNKPPTDKTMTRINRTPKSIFIGMFVLATTGIAIAIAFLIFNIKFRKHRYIKMSSPYLNNLIIIGCLFSYTSIYFLGEYEGFQNIGFLSHICEVK